ncbi:piggyBac transposable element-derived protein 4-like [Eriocheir sinensis]|uniref:piggyBac transposable element-derived protein 4-like n=1 Tax=Eriocheir sinensis TaxID=95602 RepID=UPI0021C6411F|nr:piggyBac transposable element-derived protein 4-like [Eriocheir sinensis]
MRRDRFLLLIRFLHFHDNNERDENDHLWKVRRVFTMNTKKYRQFFYPFCKVVIDETLVLFKGRLIFKQYIPSKRHRFSIKFFILCDCETGIVLDAIVYTGTPVDIPQGDPLGVSGAVVKKMMERYIGKGHILYTDNWYTSPSLCQYLLENMTGSCGTVRKNRKHMPKSEARSVPGNVELQKSGKVLAVNWHDKRDVTMLTTVHQGHMQDTDKEGHRTHERIRKPDAVIDYNGNMRLVDKSDCKLAGIECMRKCVKWYHKLFFHVVDVTMLNAYNMYLVKTGKKKKKFSYNVANQLEDDVSHMVLTDSCVRTTSPDTSRNIYQTQKKDANNRDGVMYVPLQTNVRGQEKWW